jgi:hypothetical protein
MLLLAQEVANELNEAENRTTSPITKKKKVSLLTLRQWKEWIKRE